MIVLGVDTGIATYGWARFDSVSRSFVGLGARELKRDHGRQKSDDDAARAATIADELLVLGDGCERVVIEKMSFPPGGQVPIALGFAVALTVARAKGLNAFTVRPQVWQRAVLPLSGKRVDYVELERVIGKCVRSERDSAIALDSLEPKLRNHALDACAIALMGAFRIDECTEVKACR